MEELVKMSSKGQLVVPNIIRKREKFKANDRFVAFEIHEGVVFKRIAIPRVKMDVKLQIISSDQDIKKGRVKKARKFLRELG